MEVIDSLARRVAAEINSKYQPLDDTNGLSWENRIDLVVTVNGVENYATFYTHNYANRPVMITIWDGFTTKLLGDGSFTWYTAADAREIFRKVVAEGYTI